MYKVNKMVFVFFVVPFLLIMGISCDNVFSDPVYTNNSAITAASLTDLGTTIGTTWSIGEATNLTQSLPGNWDSEDIGDPKIIKRGNLYMMWYSGKGADGVWRIGYATSMDGVTWSKDYANNPVLRPDDRRPDNLGGFIYPPDSAGVKISHIIYDTVLKKYRMWYVGWNDGSAQKDMSLFYAESKYPNKGWYKYPNGSTETISDAVVVQGLVTGTNAAGIETCIQKGIGTSSVSLERYEADGSTVTLYKVWITSLEDEINITSNPIVKSIICSSPVNFSSNIQPISALIDYSEAAAEPPFFTSGYMMPAVIRDLFEGGYIYKMWFLNYEEDTESQVGLAYAKTGSLYFRYFNETDKESLFSTNSLSQDESNIYTPCVIRDGRQYNMWYVGRDINNNKTVCFKTSN